MSDATRARARSDALFGAAIGAAAAAGLLLGMSGVGLGETGVLDAAALPPAPDVRAPSAASEVAAPREPTVPTVEVRSEQLRRRAAELLARVEAEGVPGVEAEHPTDTPKLHRLRRKTDAALLEELRRLVHAKGRRHQDVARDLPLALEVADILADRATDVAHRAAALTHKGVALRDLGRNAEADGVLTEAVRSAEPASDEWVSAQMQLAYTAAFRLDTRSCTERFLRITEVPEVSSELRARAMHLAALYLENADTSDAARLHQRVIDTFGDSPEDAVLHSLDASRRRLDALRAE